VFFLWVTRTQKQHEWFTEIIREAEENDKNNKLEVHIFITQFFDKFDLRTTMLVSADIDSCQGDSIYIFYIYVYLKLLVHLRTSFPEDFWQELVHRTAFHHSLRSSRLQPVL